MMGQGVKKATHTDGMLPQADGKQMWRHLEFTFYNHAQVN